MMTIPGLGVVAAAAVLLMSPALAQSFMERSRRDETFSVATNDPAMERAKQRGRATLDSFLAIARRPKGGMSRFSVKVGLRTGDEAEFFWIAPFQEKSDGTFSGSIANTPRHVRNIEAGQTITFAKAEIVDWLYYEGSRVRGNFTACALLKRSSKEERAQARDALGLACEGL